MARVRPNQIPDYDAYSITQQMRAKKLRQKHDVITPREKRQQIQQDQQRKQERRVRRDIDEKLR